MSAVAQDGDRNTASHSRAQEDDAQITVLLKFVVGGVVCGGMVVVVVEVVCVCARARARARVCVCVV